MRDIFKMLRVQHYIKNLLVFLPLFFSRKIFDSLLFFKSVIGFICFCLISSAVYILNDIQDVENDRKHPKKKNRPIASGRISIRAGIIIFLCCIIITFFMSISLLKNSGYIFLVIYFGLNVLYSIGGVKNKPIIDVVILASGFVLRVIYGGVITNIVVSKWLYLVILSASLFMGLGKRRNELKQKEGLREVLKYYSEADIIIKPIDYDEWRHFRFLYPLIIILMVEAISFVQKRKGILVIVLLAFGIQIGYLVFWNISYHPYQYMYFNILSKIHAEEKYERDYWYVSIYDAVEYIINNESENEYKIAAPLSIANYLLSDEQKEKVYFTTLEECMYYIDTWRTMIPLEAKQYYESQGWELIKEKKVDGIIMYDIYKK